MNNNTEQIRALEHKQSISFFMGQEWDFLPTSP